MEYEFLIGHRIHCSYFYRDEEAGIDADDIEEYYYGYSIEVTGYVQNVLIDSNNEEKIYIIEDDGSVGWVFPFHEDIEDLKIKILDWNNTEKDTKKVSRFEIMDI